MDALRLSLVSLVIVPCTSACVLGSIQYSQTAEEPVDLGPTAISFVKESGCFVDGTAATCTIAIATTANDTVCVGTGIHDSTLTVAAVTDDAAGGTSLYTKQNSVTNSTRATVEQWCTAAGAAKAATTITVTWSATGAAAAAVAGDYAGVSHVGLSATQNSNSVTATTAQVALTTQDNDNFVVSTMCYNGNETMISGSTQNLRGQAGAVVAGTGITCGLVDATSATPTATSTTITWGIAHSSESVAVELRTR